MLARAAWVESVMTSGNKDVLAVQTLRNSMIARRRRLPTIAVSGARAGPVANGFAVVTFLLRHRR